MGHIARDTRTLTNSTCLGSLGEQVGNWDSIPEDDLDIILRELDEQIEKEAQMDKEAQAGPGCQDGQGSKAGPGRGPDPTDGGVDSAEPGRKEGQCIHDAGEV